MAAADVPNSSSSSPSTDCDTSDTVHIAFVMVLVVVAITAMFLLHILGSLRRQSSHSLLHNIVMGVNTLSYPLVSYTIGRMNSSNYCYIDDYAAWAVFMLLLLGSTDNLTVFRLDDINNWKGIFVRHLFKGFLVVYIVVDLTMLRKHPMEMRPTFPYLRPLLGILSVGVLKCYVRIASMRMVSKSYLNKNIKVIADYMEHVDNLHQGPGSFDPVTMKGYKYLVAGEKYCIKRSGRKLLSNENSPKVITVEKIWQCKGNLLLPERGGMSLKDVCLSMALSKMLNRRFAGFTLSEAGLEKTHDFVFKSLLVAGDKPHQRAFRVIEEELVFVHDIYYTRYSYLYQKGRYLPLSLPIIMCGLCLWLTYVTVRDGSLYLSHLTISITVVMAFLEAYQLYLYIASGWFKVALIRSYVMKPLYIPAVFHEMIIGLLLKPKAFRPWKKRLGQYSILWEIGRRSGARNCLHYSTLRLVDKKAKKGRKKSVKLSENVKKAVVESLLRSNGILTNGITSLRNNGIDGNLSAWACDATATDGSITRTILVWHIATTLCKHQLDAQAKEEEEEEDAQRGGTVTTATTLSQYCMHLLAFAPDLLPDHSSISGSLLDQTIDEARELLKGYKKKNWCDEIIMGNRMHSGDGDGEERLFEKGVQLARHLIKDIQEPTVRWKVLSDFWAEMMLYLSPSDNARAHLEALAKGGEFITHLWALLTHAGILKRGPTGP